MAARFSAVQPCDTAKTTVPTPLLCWAVVQRRAMNRVASVGNRKPARSSLRRPGLGALVCRPSEGAAPSVRSCGRSCSPRSGATRWRRCAGRCCPPTPVWTLPSERRRTVAPIPRTRRRRRERLWPLLWLRIRRGHQQTALTTLPTPRPDDPASPTRRAAGDTSLKRRARSRRCARRSILSSSRRLPDRPPARRDAVTKGLTHGTQNRLGRGPGAWDGPPHHAARRAARRGPARRRGGARPGRLGGGGGLPAAAAGVAWQPPRLLRGGARPARRHGPAARRAGRGGPLRAGGGRGRDQRPRCRALLPRGPARRSRPDPRQP